MVEKKQSNKKSIFKTLVQVDVSKHTFQKPANKSGSIQLTYLNWAWAYSYLMFFDKDATYHFKEYPEYDFQAHQCTGRKVDYMNTTNGAYVTAVITIKGKTKEQSLPVMDAKNNAIMNPDVTYINKAKQRAFVKCLALFGLGLGLYMGEASSYKGKSGGSSKNQNDGPTDKQKSTIKWLIKVVGPKLEGDDADTFTKLEKACGTFKGASAFIGWLFKKKDSLGQPNTSNNPSNNSPRRNSDSIGSTGDVKQGSLI